jgi:3alpha(or 20beta)-hydroxysteroid dehydrogenase
MGRLDGKVALITGGARGMGAEQARAFVAEGAKVVIGDVLDDLESGVAAELGDACTAIHLDVTDPADWATAVAATEDAYGPLDVLVNNAGILRLMMLEHEDAEEFLRLYRVNALGPFLGMQVAVPAMRRAGGGSIVNISSASAMVGVFGFGSYVASKWALRGLTKVAAQEFAPDGIRVNTVLPGGVLTPMVTGLATQGGEDLGQVADSSAAGAVLSAGEDEAAVEEAQLPQPISRLGTVAEIASMVVFLASDESSYCTGADFVVDGGMTCD